jgi:hypothetical protein
MSKNRRCENWSSKLARVILLANGAKVATLSEARTAATKSA